MDELDISVAQTPPHIGEISCTRLLKSACLGKENRSKEILKTTYYWAAWRRLLGNNCYGRLVEV